MSAFSASSMRRSTGRITVDPVDLSAVWPRGGTEIGAVRSTAWEPGPYGSPIRAEELEGRTSNVVLRHATGRLSCLIRQDDTDIIDELWPVVTTSGTERVRWGRGTTPGGSPLLTGKVVLYEPREAADRAILLYNAVLVVPNPRLSLSVFQERAYPLLLLATPDANGYDWAWAKLSALSLTP